MRGQRKPVYRKRSVVRPGLRKHRKDRQTKESHGLRDDHMAVLVSESSKADMFQSEVQGAFNILGGRMECVFLISISNRIPPNLV